MCILSEFFDGLHIFDDIFASNRRSLEWRKAFESSFNFGCFDTPLIVVEVFGVLRRNLERVACGDFIVVPVVDVFFVKIVANTLLLRRPFVGGKYEVSLAGDDGRNEILLAMLFGSLGAALQMMVPGALKMVWERPIAVDPTSLEDLEAKLAVLFLSWRCSWWARAR